MKNKKALKTGKLLIGMIAAAGVIGSGFLYYKNVAASPKTVKTTALMRTELTSKVSASGTVKSAAEQNVYSNLDYPVKEILVKEGDVVKAGDVIAVLDTDTGAYDTADLDQANAQVAVDTESNNVSLCRSDLESKRKRYETNKILYDDGFISGQEIDELRKEYTDAQLKYAMAEQSYTNAVNSLTAMKVKMEKDMGRTELYAAMDGTVTRVKAKVGERPSGILFVIEDMDQLYASVDIKEFDVDSVTAGQNAVIKIEGNKQTEVAGLVDYVAVAAKESDSLSSTNVKYEAHIKFSGKDTGIRLGMNARAEIELECKNDIFAVYYDSIVTAPDGMKSVYIVEDGLVREIPVQCGMETETTVEIISDELQEGMLVITGPEAFVPGDKISAGEGY